MERAARNKFSDFFFDFCDIPQSNRDPALLTKARSLLLRLEPGFESLKLAQQRPACYFHEAIDMGSLTYFASHNASYALGLRCMTHLNSPKAIESLEIGLQFSRDLRALGDMIKQLQASSLESSCFDHMGLEILNNPQVTRPQLQELIRVLNLHRDLSAKLDPIIQSARYEHLMFKRLMHELKTNTYLPRESAKESEGDLPRAVFVMREMGYSFYDANEDEINREVDRLAKGNKEIADAAKKVKDSAPQLKKPAPLSRMILLPILHNSIGTITREDFDREMSVLTTRYQQIESAAKLSYPESTRALQRLSENWTTDDTWKTTKILRWFSPHKKLVSVRVRNPLRINALICMAAIRMWQLEHDGKNPTNLDEALSAASIKNPPVDPHSGQTLKMIADDKVLIYSVGPDGKDDLAQQEIESWVTSPDQLGDIVFELMPRDKQ